MRIGIYPGSFDPITNGHIDILERSKKISDKIIIAIARNISKKSLFSFEERLDMIKKSFDCSNTIQVVAFDGLLVDYCKKENVNFIIRGVRSVTDFEYEYEIALINKTLAQEIDTIFLVASPECSFVSSSRVKEIASFGGDVSSFVPQFVHKKLTEKFSN